MFALLISMPRFKSIIFYQNSPKIKLFLKKMQSFRALGAPPVADLGGGGWGGCIPPTSLKVTISAEKSASISNNSAPFRDASPPPA